jgi:AcrR family transcriptional regulator
MFGIMAGIQLFLEAGIVNSSAIGMLTTVRRRRDRQLAETRELRPDPNAKSDAPRTSRRKRGRPKPLEDAVGRERLVEAARTLLRTVPPAKLTRQDVAAAAGVDPALVRYYFGGLSELMTEVLKVQVQDLRDQMAALSREGGEPADRLKKRIRTFVAFLSENPAYHQLFVEQIVYGDSEWAAVSRARVTQVAFGEWTAILNDGRAKKAMRADFDPRLFYVAMIGACEFFVRGGPLFRELFPDGTRRADLLADYSDFLGELALRGIGSRESAGRAAAKPRKRRTK